MIQTKSLFHSIIAHVHWQFWLIGCCCLKIWCLLHCHEAESVLTSGSSFISEQIWIEIFIVLAIFGICVNIEKLSGRKRGIYIITYPGGTSSISDISAPWLLPGWAVGAPIAWGVGSALSSQSRSGGVAPVPLCLQRHWGLCAVPFWHETQSSDWFSWSIARCLSITSFTYLCPCHSTPQVFYFGTSAWGLLIRYYVSSIAAHKNPLLASLAIFNARRMSDCSSCAQPLCLAIVADMLKTYKQLVAAFTDLIWQLPQPYPLL